MNFEEFCNYYFSWCNLLYQVESTLYELRSSTIKICNYNENILEKKKIYRQSLSVFLVIILITSSFEGV